MVFDISNACLGFMNGMLTAANLIETGVIKAALITAGENGAPLYQGTVNQALNDPLVTRKSFKKYFASLTIGAGACACVLTHSSLSDKGPQLLCGYARNSTKDCSLCVGDSPKIPAPGLLMETDAEELLIRGIELARSTWQGFTEFSGLKKTDFDHFFCHQVGSIHRKKLYESLDLPIEKDFSTFNYYGNMGSVSLPATFAMGLEDIPVKKGQTCALLGIGSGINSIMTALRA
jgi:3-oxoacyl-[acyl-carrier-protein] synthase-3